MSLEEVLEIRQKEVFLEAIAGREVIKYIKVEDTLVRYLNLSSDEKNKVEELRKLSIDYFIGLSFESPVPKNSGYKLKDKGYSRKILDIFHIIADQNGMERVVEAYIRFKPKSRKGNVPLTEWFRLYDSNNGVKLQKNGTGSNYYWKYDRLRKLSKTSLDFDSWVLMQVSMVLVKKYKSF